MGTKAFNALYGNGIEVLATEEQDAIAAAMLALAGSGSLDIDGCAAQLRRNGYPAPSVFEYKPTRQNTFDCLRRDRRASRGAVV